MKDNVAVPLSTVFSQPDRCPEHVKKNFSFSLANADNPEPDAVTTTHGEVPLNDVILLTAITQINLHDLEQVLNICLLRSA